jgi:hypothetical protein
MEQLRLLLIPLVIIAFNAVFMLIMRTILLGVSKTWAPFVALAIASSILVIAVYLARRSPAVETVAEEHGEHHG